MVKEENKKEPCDCAAFKLLYTDFISCDFPNAGVNMEKPDRTSGRNSLKGLSLILTLSIMKNIDRFVMNRMQRDAFNHSCK